MIELIERLEKATGESRELDRAIAEAISGVPQPIVTFNPQFVGSVSIGYSAPRYTGSTDAALGLVPEGWRSGYEMAGRYDRDQRVEAWCWPFESAFKPDWQLGYEGYRSASDGMRAAAATPALALCIAALRARSAMKTCQALAASESEA